MVKILNPLYRKTLITFISRINDWLENFINSGYFDIHKQISERVFIDSGLNSKVVFNYSLNF